MTHPDRAIEAGARAVTAAQMKWKAENGGDKASCVDCPDELIAAAVIAAYETQRAAEGLNDCIDNAGKPYQSEFMAATLKAAKDWLDSPLCTFCRHRVGNDSITDKNGEIACRSCGEAEINAQRMEARDAGE